MYSKEKLAWSTPTPEDVTRERKRREKVRERPIFEEVGLAVRLGISSAKAIAYYLNFNVNCWSLIRPPSLRAFESSELKLWWLPACNLQRWQKAEEVLTQTQSRCCVAFKYYEDLWLQAIHWHSQVAVRLKR